jgi:hypothetical protein
MLVFGSAPSAFSSGSSTRFRSATTTYYEGKAVEQQTRSLTVSAERGNIYDAEGNKPRHLRHGAERRPLPKGHQETSWTPIFTRLGPLRASGVDYDTVYARTQKTAPSMRRQAPHRAGGRGDRIRAFIRRTSSPAESTWSPTQSATTLRHAGAHVLGFCRHGQHRALTARRPSTRITFRGGRPRCDGQDRKGHRNAL